MTTTYRKTATIEATQWFKMGDHPAVVLKSNPNRYADEGIPWCPTMEGGHVVTPGDWIATGIRGEHWRINPDVFAETYTQVDAALSTPATEPQPAADTRVVTVETLERWRAEIEWWEQASGITSREGEEIRAIIDNATPAPSDKIVEAALERTARYLREYQMQGRITVDWGKVPKSQRKKWFDLADVALRALAGKGE